MMSRLSADSDSENPLFLKNSMTASTPETAMSDGGNKSEVGSEGEGQEDVN